MTQEQDDIDMDVTTKIPTEFLCLNEVTISRG